jgi:hypothetical protein
MAPAFSVLEFDVTPDAKEVVFSTQPPHSFGSLRWTGVRRHK